MAANQLYVLLDSDGDIVETFPENSNFDYMFQRKHSICPYGTLHKAVSPISRFPMLSEPRSRRAGNLPNESIFVAK